LPPRVIIGFEKYKAFPGPEALELRPITLLFGHNSVGKSAALRLIPILAGAARGQRPETARPAVFDYSSPALRGARFAELVNATSSGGGLSFSIEWPWSVLSFTVRELDEKDGEVVTDFTFTTDGYTVDALLAGSPGERLYDVKLGDEIVSDELKLSGLLPEAAPGARPPVISAIQRLRHDLTQLSEGVRWIGSVRSQPPRYFEMGPATKKRIEPDGSGVEVVLRASQLEADGVADAVSAWLKAACGCELSFASTDTQVVLGRALHPFQIRGLHGTDAMVAVRDVGEGVAQALPVVTLCHQALRGQLGPTPILLFEQPELHLHPHAGVRLAEEVVNCVVNHSPAIHVIETHSESFLLSMQIALVEGKISPDDIRVYWIEQTAAGSSLLPIEFDSEGYPSAGWPEGVFREALGQARRLAELRIAQA